MEIHIGAKIKEKANELKMRSTDLAHAINTTRQNVNTIYKRKSIDTDQLLAISKALNFNFFNLYQEEFKKMSTGHVATEEKGDYGINNERIAKVEELLQEILSRLEYLETGKDN